MDREAVTFMFVASGVLYVAWLSVFMAGYLCPRGSARNFPDAGASWPSFTQAAVSGSVQNPGHFSSARRASSL